MWAKTAAVGAIGLVVIFATYEIVERIYLVKHYSVDELFLFHMYRGIGCSLLLASWAFYNIWRTRRRYDDIFQAAYRDLRLAMEERTRALAEAKSFTDRLFDSLRDQIVVLDRDGRIVKANRVALDAAGCTTVSNAPCTDFFGASCEPTNPACVARKALATGAPATGEFVRTDPRTGRIYAVDAFPVPDADGKQALVIETARDITEEKRLEAELRYQEKLSALGMLAAGIAHDIGNPLASMSSELEMLERERDPERVRNAAAVLREHIARITRTLREMSDFARRRGDEVTAVVVENAVKDALRMVRHDPRARKIRIASEFDRDMPTLRMVEDHLVMVLVNLFINAFDAMPEGGTLTIRGDCANGGVRLRVIDTGVGMNDEVKRRALEPLFTTKGRGTGLGLSVSVDVVRSVGGTLSIESAPGVGTAVTLEFGAVEEKQEPEKRNHRDTENTGIGGEEKWG
ncbi:MAG: PAS domain-containing protein [Deltaproteobacteria bacterium]|nr:PAS domain-containing protein [Deltaproteobacteria bacterium]